jgi:DNA-binding response OmpR family regulator
MTDVDQQARGGPDGQPRVLVVEPKRDYLAVLARRIAEAGYRPVGADAPQAAMAELRRQPVALVLAELAMPANGGIELVRMIRDETALRDMPVLLIAGRSDNEAAVEAFASGADGIVRKPFHFEVLIARIGREIERARSVAGLREDNAALDARVVSRSIELGEMRDRWLAAESERLRLDRLVGKR